MDTKAEPAVREADPLVDPEAQDDPVADPPASPCPVPVIDPVKYSDREPVPVVSD